MGTLQSARFSGARREESSAMDASAWLSDFERVERNVDDAFACLYERDAAQREGRAADATELTATVRKQAAELRSELDALGASLELSSVTEREKIRREDLVAGLYGRCDELAGLSSADAGYVSSSPPSSTNFFQPEPDSHSGETPATVDLDNAGILQLQRNMMTRQDDELDELSRVVSSKTHRARGERGVGPPRQAPGRHRRRSDAPVRGSSKLTRWLFGCTRRPRTAV